MGERNNDISRLFAGPFPALEERLLSRLPESFGRVRGREDVLLVPSNELREHLLRRLAARGEWSAAGASILTLYDFAVRLLKYRGVFPRELPAAQASAAMLAAVREVYATGEGDFAAISGTPGFVPALSRTMADFEEGWLGEEAIGKRNSGRAPGGTRRPAGGPSGAASSAPSRRKSRPRGGCPAGRSSRRPSRGSSSPGIRSA